MGGRAAHPWVCEPGVGSSKTPGEGPASDSGVRTHTQLWTGSSSHAQERMVLHVLFRRRLLLPGCRYWCLPTWIQTFLKNIKGIYQSFIAGTHSLGLLGGHFHRNGLKQKEKLIECGTRDGFVNKWSGLLSNWTVDEGFPNKVIKVPLIKW